MSGEMDRYFHSRRALKKRVDEQNAEITTLRARVAFLEAVEQAAQAVCKASFDDRACEISIFFLIDKLRSALSGAAQPRGEPE